MKTNPFLLNFRNKQYFFLNLLAFSATILMLFTSATPAYLSSATESDSVVEQMDNGSGFASVLYDNSSGLPTSEANAIVQSADGFIWIGGYSGLIRYDGNDFERYDSSTGISSVVCLFVDSKERLWIGTNDNGVAMLKDDSFKFFNRDNGLRSSSIRSISEDSDGNIIIATTMGMAYIDTDDTLNIIDDPQINKEYIRKITKDKNGIIYGITLSNSFFTIQNHRVTGLYSPSISGVNEINCICSDPDNPGWIYLGTQNDTIVHININDPAQKNSISVSPDHAVDSICCIGDRIWIGCENGIGYINKNEKYIKALNLPMTNSVVDIMEDYEGNLWFCSSRQGVMKIVSNSFIDISKLANLKAMVVNSTHKYGNDLYLATDKGLFILNEKFETIENDITKILEGVRIRCIREDKSHRIWMCTYSDYGLVCYDPQTQKYFTLSEKDGMASNRVRAITELSDGTIAVATNGGVNMLRKDKVISTLNSSHGISNLEILCIEESSDGKVYLGSDGDGIYILNGNMISRLGVDDGLASEVILRIKKDPVNDIYWIITSNSIAYMKDEKITTIKNFPYSNNFDIYFDNNDRLWILSSNGIYVVKRDEMVTNDTIVYRLFDTKSGLPSVPTANSFSYLSPDGELYISSNSGVSSININNTDDNNEQIKIGVPFIRADDTYISASGKDEIHIPSSNKRITIYANAFTYSLNNPYIRYYLEGFDDTPIEITKKDLDYISYTNLCGGTYRFHFALVNTMTGKADQEVIVTIVKDKALHEQLWFMILAAVTLVMIIIFIIAMFFRNKTAKLLRKQQEHKKLINEMTQAFAKCVDMKDKYTNGHSFRVAQYSQMIAEKLGWSKKEIEKLYNIALLHDIGKISIPDNILNKPGRLNDEEYQVMRSHSSRGYEILKDITIEPDLAQGAKSHHERFDGTGYPDHIKGDDIPETAQIIAVADTFDAMYSTRPYRRKMKLDDVLSEIKRCSGTQLNPKMVDIFLELADEGALENVGEDSPLPPKETA